MRRLVFAVALVGLVAAACSGSSTTASTSKYCQVARNLSRDIKLNASSDFRATFQQFDSFAGQYLAAVPPEIKADSNTFVDGVRKLETVLRKYNFDVYSLPTADATALQTSLSDPKYMAAGDRLAAYNLKNCGITTPTT